MGAPNAIRIILLVFSAVSFWPQYARILSRGDCAGLSGKYLLFNLIAATQQFALELYYVVAHDEVDFVVHSPPTLGDYLDLAQFAVVWLGHLVIFAAYIYYPPSSPGSKGGLVSAYVAFLLVSLVPVIFIASLPRESRRDDVIQARRWYCALFGNTSSFLINPIVTALAAAAYIPQVRELRSRPDVGAVSVFGLAFQAVVFLAVSVAWPFRIATELPHGVTFFTWYQFGGWATVDNLVFALVQAALWWVARRFTQAARWDAIDETTPLTGA